MGELFSAKVRPGWVSAVALGTLLGLIMASYGCAPTVKDFHWQLISMPVVGGPEDTELNSGYVPSPANTCHAGVTQMLRIAKTLGLKINLVAKFERDDIMGRLVFSEQAVYVKDGLTSCGQLEILAHEIAHIYAPTALAGQPAAELFCDAVSNLVTYRLSGIDSTNSNARGNRMVKFQAYTLLAYEPDINRVAAYLTTGQWPK